MSTNARNRKTNTLSSYIELVNQFPLVSIRSESQLGAAQAVVDRLLAVGRLDSGETMYLDALSDQIAVYEDIHYPIDANTDADMLRHLMGAKGVNQTELHRATGIPKSTVSEILSGKKPFSRSIIRTLTDYFQVSAGVLAANL